MQVNLAGALDLLGLTSQKADDAQVAADFTAEEVQAKRMPPTTASIAIDEAIVEAMESAQAEIVEPDPPPIVQPNKTPFEAKETQPNADSKELDEEWGTEKPAISLRNGDTKQSDTPPILRPALIASALQTPLPPSGADGFVSPTADKQERSVSICFAKPEVSAAGSLKPEPTARGSRAIESAVSREDSIIEPRMAPPLRPSPDARSNASDSDPKTPQAIATENGDTFAVEWPLPWFPEDPTDPIYSEKSHGQKPKPDAAADAPAPSLRPRPAVSPVASDVQVKVLDKLERLLARIAPDARATIIAVRDFAIKSAMQDARADESIASDDAPTSPIADRASQLGASPKQQALADAVSFVKQEIKQLVAPSLASGLMDKFASGGSRFPNAQAIFDRISQRFAKLFGDNDLRVLLPRDETPTIHEAKPPPTLGPISPGAQKPISTSANAVAAQKVAPSVMAGVINRIEQMLDDRKGQSVTIRLDPPELGTIDVTVKTVSGRVDTQIIASNGDVRQFVEANRELLAQALANRGLELGSMSVGAQANGNGQAQTPVKPFVTAWRPDVQSASTMVARWSTATALDFSA